MPGEQRAGCRVDRFRIFEVLLVQRDHVTGVWAMELAQEIQLESSHGRLNPTWLAGGETRPDGGICDSFSSPFPPANEDRGACAERQMNCRGSGWVLKRVMKVLFPD